MNLDLPIEVAVAANSGYFDGLAVVLESLLRSNRENIFRVHVIDGGLRAGERRFILLRIKRHNALNEVLFHSIENHHFQGFRLDYGNSYMTYARMLIGSLVDSAKVLYLDTDLLVAADVRPLWETPLDEAIVAAAPDPSIRSLRDDYPLEDECGDEPYFNAGVMLIDLSKWRKENVESELFQMIGRQPGKFKWWDQTAMNALFRRRVHLLDPSGTPSRTE
jgi:lipopolysaccharide biosynthesis glycosyltransferase